MSYIFVQHSQAEVNSLSQRYCLYADKHIFYMITLLILVLGIAFPYINF